MKHKQNNAQSTVTVVIETPRGCRNKYKYKPSSGRYELSSVLPAGNSFPYDFGFVPETEAADGDPIDVLLLMDESAFPGCEVKARLVGVIEAEQTEKSGKPTRNDRLLAVAESAHNYGHIQQAADIDSHLLEELEQFFVSYNMEKGKKFRLLGVHGPKRAQKLLTKARTSK